MNYETKEIKSERLIIKKGEEKDFLKVYEYDFNKLKNIEGICVSKSQSMHSDSYVCRKKGGHVSAQSFPNAGWEAFCLRNHN